MRFELESPSQLSEVCNQELLKTVWRTPFIKAAQVYSSALSVLSQELRANKLTALEAGRPEVIATANIGCLVHLSAGTQRPVRHWIELLEGRLMGRV